MTLEEMVAEQKEICKIIWRVLDKIHQEKITDKKDMANATFHVLNHHDEFTGTFLHELFFEVRRDSTGKLRF